MYKIIYNKNKCIGCGACASVSDNWKMVGAKAKPIKTSLSDIGSNKDARDVCPVGAIQIR